MSRVGPFLEPSYQNENRYEHISFIDGPLMVHAIFRKGKVVVIRKAAWAAVRMV